MVKLQLDLKKNQFHFSDKNFFNLQLKANVMQHILGKKTSYLQVNDVTKGIMIGSRVVQLRLHTTLWKMLY